MNCAFKDSPDPCDGEVKICHAMTAYHFTGELNSEEDPNKDFLCCEYHYKMYEEHWTEMWNEYYFSQGR